LSIDDVVCLTMLSYLFLGTGLAVHRSWGNA
jgi:hypothetical protein